MKPFDEMSTIDRRRFLKSSLLGAAAISLATGTSAGAAKSVRKESAATRQDGIIDTNVNLFEWPFRALKYRKTDALIAKLRKHRIIQAWAGSFEALFSKDIDGVNSRLAAECAGKRRSFLVPFGAVNLAWPDWEDDARRCHEIYKMPGIRIYPGYQPFDLDHRDVASLLNIVSERGLILQVVFGMEDPRVYHPILNIGPVTLAPLLAAMKNAPSAKVQLIHFAGTFRGNELAQFLSLPNTALDISRLEGNGALGRMIGTIQGLPSARVPVDRIMFGSHAPYCPVETALLKLVESPLDGDQLDAVMQGNARRFLPRA